MTNFVVEAQRHFDQIVPGFLQVAAGAGPRFGLPFVVRDARLRVVHRGIVGTEPFRLPEGLHSLEMVTPTGVPAAALVKIRPNVLVRVLTDRGLPDPAESSPYVNNLEVQDVRVWPESVDSNRSLWQRYLSYQQPTAGRTRPAWELGDEGIWEVAKRTPSWWYTGSALRFDKPSGSRPTWDWLPRHADRAYVWRPVATQAVADSPSRRDELYASEFAIEATSGCEAVRPSPAHVVIVPTTDSFEQTSTVTFRLGSQRSVMSIPLNTTRFPAGRRECIVSVVREHGQDRLRLSSPPGRDRLALITGLLLHNVASSAIEAIRAAGSELEIESNNELALSGQRLSDPAASALSCLTLHRLGLLEDRSIVERLARDFKWIPDGQILYAALLMKDSRESERARGLRTLLAASRERPFYTDGLSLALELLRRWPDDSEPLLSERMSRLERLAGLWATAEPSSINLSTVIADDH